MGYCPECGKKLDKKTGECKNCAKKNDPKYNAKNKKKKIIIITVISIIAAMVIVGIVIASPKKVKPLYDKEGKPVYVTESEFESMYTDPEKVKGKFVDMVGLVFNEPEKNGETTIVQIYADPANNEKNTIIYCNENANVKTGDFVKIKGYVGGKIEYKNAFGGILSAPYICTKEIKKSNYKDVVSPTKKEVNYTDKKINQQGYSIEVNKVEFSDIETRVYVTVKNEAKADLDVYTYGSVILQDGKQYQYTENYDAKYQRINDEIKPGITSEGVLVFPKINQSNFELVIEAHSSDYHIDLNEFKFSL